MTTIVTPDGDVVVADGAWSGPGVLLADLDAARRNRQSGPYPWHGAGRVHPKDPWAVAGWLRRRYGHEAVTVIDGPVVTPADVAVADDGLVAHLPGQHDQSTHGRGGGKLPDGVPAHWRTVTVDQYPGGAEQVAEILGLAEIKNDAQREALQEMADAGRYEAVELDVPGGTIRVVAPQASSSFRALACNTLEAAARVQPVGDIELHVGTTGMDSGGTAGYHVGGLATISVHPRLLSGSVPSGDWHPPATRNGSTSQLAVAIVHEYGHRVGDVTGFDPARYAGRGGEVSGYAATNDAEIVSEGFVEWMFSEGRTTVPVVRDVAADLGWGAPPEGWYRGVTDRSRSALTAHLPGQHDQSTHGRKGGGVSNAERAMLAAADGGGFTYNPLTGDQPRTGYAVAIPGHSQVIRHYSTRTDGHKLAAIRSYMDDNHEAALADPELHIGGWLDRSDDTFWLDLSQVLPATSAGRAEAIRRGEERNERAIADLAAIAAEDWGNAFVDTGGTGNDPGLSAAAATVPVHGEAVEADAGVHPAGPGSARRPEPPRSGTGPVGAPDVPSDRRPRPGARRVAADAKRAALVAHPGHPDQKVHGRRGGSRFPKLPELAPRPDGDRAAIIEWGREQLRAADAALDAAWTAALTEPDAFGTWMTKDSVGELRAFAVALQAHYVAVRDGAYETAEFPDSGSPGNAVWAAGRIRAGEMARLVHDLPEIDAFRRAVSTKEGYLGALDTLAYDGNLSLKGLPEAVFANVPRADERAAVPSTLDVFVAADQLHFPLGEIRRSEGPIGPLAHLRVAGDADAYRPQLVDSLFRYTNTANGPAVAKRRIAADVGAELHRRDPSLTARQWGEIADDLQAGWAESSMSERSQAFQAAVAAEFGLDAKVAVADSHSANRPNQKILDQWDEQRAQRTGASSDRLRAVARATYDITQARLATDGVSALAVYRGMKWHPDVLPDAVVARIPAETFTPRSYRPDGRPYGFAHDTHEWVEPHAPMERRPLASWSANRATAEDSFAAPGGGLSISGSARAVETVAVPAAAVFSMPGTGPGASREWETVLLPVDASNLIEWEVMPSIELRSRWESLTGLTAAADLPPVPWDPDWIKKAAETGLVAHLAGQHDQSTHGRKGGGGVRVEVPAHEQALIDRIVAAREPGGYYDTHNDKVLLTDYRADRLMSTIKRDTPGDEIDAILASMDTPGEPEGFGWGAAASKVVHWANPDNGTDDDPAAVEAIVAIDRHLHPTPPPIPVGHPGLLDRTARPASTVTPETDIPGLNDLRWDGGLRSDEAAVVAKARTVADLADAAAADPKVVAAVKAAHGLDDPEAVRRVAAVSADRALNAWATSSMDLASQRFQALVDDEFRLGARVAIADKYHDNLSNDRLIRSRTEIDSSRFAAMDDVIDRALVRAMYAHTQAQLAAAGVTEVTVHRGMKVHPDGAVPELAAAARRAFAGWTPGSTVDGYDAPTVVNQRSVVDAVPEMRPLSSWSVRPSSAKIFAPDGISVIQSATVPARAVFSMPGTGLGAYREQELVMLPFAAGAVTSAWALENRVVEAFLADQPVTASARKRRRVPDWFDPDWIRRHPDELVAHLAGQHDQKTHGRGGGRKTWPKTAAPVRDLGDDHPGRDAAQLRVSQSIADALGFDSDDPADVAKARRIVDDFAEAMIADVFTNPKPRMHIDSADLVEALKDGAFYPWHHPDVEPSAGGATNRTARDLIEEEQMGLDGDAPWHERPVYLSLELPTDEELFVLGSPPLAASFGDVEVSFNPDVMHRASVTIGDTGARGFSSREIGPVPVAYDRLMDGVPRRTFASMTDPTIFSEALMNAPEGDDPYVGVDDINNVGSWVEAQVYGGLTVKDIRFVTLSPRAVENSPQLEQMLDRRGIPYTVSIDNWIDG